MKKSKTKTKAKKKSKSRKSRAFGKVVKYYGVSVRIGKPQDGQLTAIPLQSNTEVSPPIKKGKIVLLPYSLVYSKLKSA